MLGCFISLNDLEKAKELLDKIPDLLEKRKIGGKDLPTEVFIKKKSMCDAHLPCSFVDKKQLPSIRISKRGAVAVWKNMLNR